MKLSRLCTTSQDEYQCVLYLSLSCILKEVNAVEMFGNTAFLRFSGRFVCMLFLRETFCGMWKEVCMYVRMYTVP